MKKKIDEQQIHQQYYEEIYGKVGSKGEFFRFLFGCCRTIPMLHDFDFAYKYFIS